MEKMIDEEINYNSLDESKYNQPIIFNQPVIIKHAKSQCYLGVEIDTSKTYSFQVVLTTNVSQNSIWVFHPYFSF